MHRRFSDHYAYEFFVTRRPRAGLTNEENGGT